MRPPGRTITGMRIIAGSARGRPITAPPAGTRPTSDRVRESVFAMLDARVDLDGARVLDLYAGSGALGLESLSRGAVRAVFVESDAKAASTIAGNAARCGFTAASLDVRRRRVETVVSAAADDRFDIVFCDPPYDVDTEVVEGHLQALADHDWCAPGALVVVERSARTPQITWPSAFTPERSRRYGETRVDLGEVADPEQE
ncbi:16S rRNA (guanine(966)-N(2))-methyltransferase RsmD [Williamsia herbipolensis]|uniref:16S rRNA (guanine(966)-N(2))-methyltransferase RsmD n=1 Tax=Williamsia herbipolensis TaxID=1603258 RepID=UPI0023AA1B10|nr:16S rRNA (guanine(966)-N(2))-methyltransferase RsmD [Williamsia herbipolensis]